MKETSAKDRKSYYPNSVISDDTVISSDNIKDIAEIIALRALRQVAAFANHSLDSMYKGLLRDIYRNGTITQVYSDGYDFVQTAICYLLEHIGERLGDKVKRYKRIITVRQCCFCVVNAAIHNHQYYRCRVDRLDKYEDYEITDNEVIDTEESYSVIDERIERMNLTAGERQTLDCYMSGMQFTEIVRFLNVSTTTVWRRRMSLQRKHTEFIGF